jgi:hypothetical protein
VDARPLGSTNTVGQDHRAWTPMHPGVQRLLVHPDESHFIRDSAPSPA